MEPQTPNLPVVLSCESGSSITIASELMPLRKFTAHVPALLPLHAGRQLVCAGCDAAREPVDGRRSLRMLKNWGRSMKNGSARSPAKTCVPVAHADTRFYSKLEKVAFTGK